LLSRLSPEQVERVGRHPLRVELHEGRWLFGQGDPAERFYLVRKGQIRFFRRSPEGADHVQEPWLEWERLLAD